MLVQGGAGGAGAAQGISASSAPHVSGQEELGYAEGMGQEGTRSEGEEQLAPQEAIQVLHHSMMGLTS